VPLEEHVEMIDRLKTEDDKLEYEELYGKIEDVKK